ncbi:MAG: hypothetical protein J5833_05275 [Victivallales bacterium]|nr:hypothetical protein [Victivallales bacterium]
MKKKKKQDRLSVCLSWHTPRHRNALEGERGRNTRFMVFTVAVVGVLLALMGVFREFF